MLRMILADDEPIITRGIRKLLDWKMFGIEIMGEYEDGRKAYEAIIREKPNIALLDISMPGMSGVDILRECRAMNNRVAVIFISGFQDFEYAKAALQYGAVDYLLKPVIREELLKAIEKSIVSIGEEKPFGQEDTKEKIGNGVIDYGPLITEENDGYVPIYADIVYRKEEDEQIKKLVHFSLISFLEEYLNETGEGIVFQKDGKIVIVLKRTDAEEAYKIVLDIWEKSVEATGHTTFFVVGDAVHSMSEIPEMFRQCLTKSGYLFFAEQMAVPVKNLHEKIFAERENMETPGELRQKLFDAAVAQNEGQMQEVSRRYGKLVLRLADGKKEDACFYYCTAVRFVEEHFAAYGLTGRGTEMRKLLEKGRACESFSEMKELFEQEFAEYLEMIRETAVNSEKKDILKAKEYIEKHYMENLSLNVLADEIHMNAYYFSSFFKKNTGENFKEYVNQVRIKHALPMLLSSDMRTYEIAEKVGFRDIRIFNAAFMKIYQETPGSYRKRVREQQDERND